MAVVSPDMDTMNDLTEFEQNALAGFQFYQEWDSGYSKQQSTRPQTLGYGLTDSPIGQAAWILSKSFINGPIAMVIQKMPYLGMNY